jgi:hypothetical protein
MKKGKKIEEEDINKCSFCHFIKWLLQHIIWTCLFILIAYSYYLGQSNDLKNQYINIRDSNGVPYYGIKWKESDLNNYFFYPALFTFLVAYITYMIIQFRSGSCKYLKHKSDSNDKNRRMESKLNELFRAKPKITFTCTCYHYETIILNDLDEQGKARTRKRKNKVITHEESFDFPYHSVRDVSGLFSIKDSIKRKKDYIKLNLKLVISWADAISRADYEQQKNNFIEKNRTKDELMDFNEIRSLPDFNDKDIIEINHSSTCSVNLCWYIISVIFAFTEYYKWYIKSRRICQNFTIIKIISSRYNLLKKDKEKFEEMKPKIEMSDKQLDYQNNDIGFVEDEELNLPSMEEIENAEQKYGAEIPDYKLIDNGRRKSVFNFNQHEENYPSSLVFNRDSKVPLKENIQELNNIINNDEDNNHDNPDN